ncbi:nucleoside diphosphatase Ynd1 [Schizosaccharomyces pombe]|uniref:Golgi apyrase n=1 Tax=Schizosaccharomyces pombe (strain 972 / ATCC 24843) TaxID=284812 RepID=YND1_SCHPO|nr:nucleoside diphosphatase Ynd1 [Schizosaccharomyces pombe]Q9USP2.1 RecName: Full=Golgi apyrase; AltName: Full=ATP-diphosphatase; AltName: Full=ATP-diphosphohydrolase; AltName: Full=Adenosine diphosphatase; Short=ADPase; AltName: Full=Golgi nucleoside diphosphatase [Schizosaccharomyces pombe 972h-]CAB57847.1 nucleoside diphosphatase Ynd1 [Schizosaccharomyces pombe]|eukprot:NP_588201.1 nucleoside diphosphatase Ynd1 [Schizosaccharomyces pombe]
MVRKYGIFIDAGSSGSRLLIYSWDYDTDSSLSDKVKKLPLIETGIGDGGKWSLKVQPGISSFANNPKHVGKKHLKELLDFAAHAIPKDVHKETPVFLSATAGMRLLGVDAQNKILSHACRYIKKNYDFDIPNCSNSIRVIDGKAEGMYGWLATNYLLKTLEEKDTSTVGFLDMGGASVQIAFELPPSQLKNYKDSISTVHIGLQNGQQLEYPLFVTTWLGFGANEAYRRYLGLLIESENGKVGNTLSDPCSLRGRTYDIDGIEFAGTGDLKQCLKLTYNLLNKDKPCSMDPCNFDGISIPPVDFANTEFVGVSEFWYTTNDVFDMGGSYHFPNFYKKVDEYCGTEWETMLSRLYNKELTPSTDENKLEKLCFKASWALNVLHEGFDVPKSNTSSNDAKDGLSVIPAYHSPFTSLEKIERTEVSWTLGQVLLYASNQQLLAKPEYANYYMDPYGKLIASPSKHWMRLFPNKLFFILSFIFCLFFLFSLVLFGYDPKRRQRFKKFLLRLQRRKAPYIMSANGSYEDIADFSDDLEMSSPSKWHGPPIRTTSSHVLADRLSFTASRERTPRSPFP